MVLPEVFLKAVSVNYNLGTKPVGVTCASFDMIQHYRVRENLVNILFSRPFADNYRVANALFENSNDNQEGG